MKTRAQALELVRAAFGQAQQKLGPKATTMTLAVLNNRLLQITDRRFQPKDFGVKDLRSFASLVAPEFRLVGEPPRMSLEIANGTHREDAAPSPQPLVPVGLQVTSGPQLPAGGRIRAALWLSVVDYASGTQYVWDNQLGQARAALPGEAGPRMPTLTPLELSEWRLTFVETHRSGLSAAALVSAQRWQEQGLSTNYLPTELQQPWNRELTMRVRLRLQEFFSKINLTASTTDDTSASSAATPTK